MADDEKWTFVGRKGKASRKAPLKQLDNEKTDRNNGFVYIQTASRNQNGSTGDKVATITTKIERIVERMRTSDFMLQLQVAMDQNLHSMNVSMQLVCYGLGNFNTNNAAYQLACAVLIREWLTKSKSIELKHAYLYDPIMTQEDNQVASNMKFEVLTTNEQGQRCAEFPTIFFMPHCGKKLYQNVLLSNWGTPLQQVYILGNSFSAYDDRVVVAADRKASIFSTILPYLEETPVGKIDKKFDEYVQYDAAFNDLRYEETNHLINRIQLPTSFHKFPIEELMKADEIGIFDKDVDDYKVGTDEDLL